MPSPTIHDLIRFSELILELQAVERSIYIPGGRALKENDVEHSYALAMAAWYLNEAGSFGLDTGKLLRYALVHDLPEAYAGDVAVLDHAARVGKAKREAAAMSQIQREFPEVPFLLGVVHAYEALADPESNFVYALDKLMPMVMVYLEGGRAWHELGYDLEELIANKEEKMAGCPPVLELGRQLEAMIRARPTLFPPARSEQSPTTDR